MTIQQHATFDSSAAELNATSKLVKAWESKNAKNAAKFGGISLMALSLAACGGSDDTVAVVDGGTAADDTAATDDAATTTVSDTQKLAAQYLTTISTSDAAVESATITTAASAAVLAANELTVAPTTIAAANTAIAAHHAQVLAEVTTGAGAGGDGLDEAIVLEDIAAALGANFAAMVGDATNVLAADKTAFATADADIRAALAFELSADVATLTGLNNTAGAANTATDEENAVLATVAATGTMVGSNNYTDATTADTTALTAAETLAGQIALATSVNATLLANDETYATAWALLTAAEQAVVVEAIAADASITGANVAQSTTSGAVIGITSVEAIYTAAAGLIAGADNQTAGLVLPAGAVAADLLTAAAGAVINLAPAGAINAVEAQAEDNAHDAAAVADITALLDAAITVGAAAEAADVAGIQAGLVSTESLGAENIVLATDTVRAGTDGNDVFLFAENGAAITVGTAATAAAPENVFGGVGTDSIVIEGTYTFVVIDKDEFDNIQTTNLGNESVLEALVYTDATTGNTVMSFEENAFDGNITNGAGAMTTVTVTDWAFDADLVSSATVDGSEFSIVSAAAAAVIA